jgi:hypothetical protein
VVFGARHHAEALREEVSAVLASLGLRLAPEKTAVPGFRSSLASKVPGFGV